jgi:hypothetical protein
MLLIYTLIILIAFLLGYQLFSEVFTNKLIECLENQEPPAEKEYQPYNLSDPNNALILAQQNAGNIQVLKGRIDTLDGVKEKIDTMQQNINSMQVQMDGLVQQQADYAAEIAGSTPPTITGTEEDDEEEII